MGDIYQQTIDILQGPSNPIVDKPKLAEKYLSKPPFRFLHDVISAVQANTGFAPGLYSGEELDAKAIQDKEQKVAYLSKIINVVGLVLGEQVPAKPLKIVAGLEPENTNVFLQMLGKACRMNNGADAVQRVLAGDTQESAGKAPPPAAAQEPPKRSKSTERSSSSKSKAAPPPPAAEPEEPPPPEPKPKSKPKPKAAPPPEPEEPPPRAPSPVEDPALRSSQGGRAVPARPQSARKAPPKLPSGAGQASAAVGGVRTGARRGPPAAGGAASAGGNKPIALFEEGKAGSDDDDVEVVHEQRPMALGPRGDDGEKGVLVKDILSAEEKLKKAGADAAPEEEAAGQGIILKRLGKPSAGGAGAGPGAVKPNDLAGIRELVQKLCQSSHPLAKSMDFLAEDLENMSKEYRFWVTERRVFQDKLDEEQRLVSDRENFAALLADLDSQIKQVKDRIIGVKANILRNDETVSKLLSMAVGK